MSASAILRSCAAVGVIIQRDGTNLKLNAKAPPPPELLRSIKEHKAELIAFLTPPPSITAFEERAAILEFDGGMSRAEANDAAAIQLGYSHLRAFYSAVLHSWRTAIEASFLPAPASDAEQLIFGKFDTLKNSSLGFLDSEFARQAVSCGWCELSLFGVHEGLAPTARLDALGLLPLIAWSALNLKLTGIGREHAVLASCAGATLKHPRFRTNFSEACVWWAHPQFK